MIKGKDIVKLIASTVIYSAVFTAFITGLIYLLDKSLLANDGAYLVGIIFVLCSVMVKTFEEELLT